MDVGIWMNVAAVLICMVGVIGASDRSVRVSFVVPLVFAAIYIGSKAQPW